MNDKCNGVKCVTCEYIGQCSKYDDLPMITHLKVNKVNTREQRDALTRIAERIDSALMCINGVCSNVR